MIASAPSYGVLGALEIPLGLGLLRLATEGRPDRADALAVIVAALEAGIRVLDTADSYALDDKDRHYGEALARDAIAAWGGPAGDVRVITKAGFARPKGRWVPDGSAKALTRAVEGSLRALGVDALPLLLLHGRDPQRPFEESLATLAALQRAGKIVHLGLCNVDVAELRQAERHFVVAAVQNELSVASRASAAEGTLAYARAQGIPFLAHRPLGGHAKTAALAKNRAVAPIAERHGITRHEAALAALLDLGAPVVPLVGATSAERIGSWKRAAAVRLDDADRAALASKLSFEPDEAGRAALVPHVIPEGLRPLVAGEGPGRDPEVVVVLGVQGAGKSTVVQRYVDAGYERLNRDLLGGALDDLIPALSAHLAAGRSVVLDNTYGTRTSRWPVLRAAHAAGVPVRCIHLDTPVREALINVVTRVLERHGRLLGPDDLKALSKTDPNLPPPAALSRYVASFEPPRVDEGFSVVEVVPFVRRHSGGTAKALLLDVDGTLRRTLSGELYPTHPDDIELLPRRREILAGKVAEGWRLFFVSNQSGVASEKVTDEAVRACFDRTRELLGVPVEDVAYCPHPAFPVGCFCRKPMPGMGVDLARRHGLDPAQLVVVGDLGSDAKFAEAIGATFVSAEVFFGEAG